MAAKTWDGEGGDNNWSTGQNWNGNTVPATTDTITFDNTSVKNCTVDALGTWSGGTVTVAATYTGVITQNVTINIAAFAFNGGAGSGWTSAANFTSTTFSVATGAIAVGFTKSSGSFSCTSFTLSSGKVDLGAIASATTTGAVAISSAAGSPSCAVTCPTGTWTHQGSWSQAGTALITFNANGGTIAFTVGSITVNMPSITFNLVTINCNQFTVSGNTTIPLGASPTATMSGGNTLQANSGATISASGTFTVAGGAINMANGSTLSGAITQMNVAGSLTFGATSTISAATIPVLFNGSIGCVVTATAYTFGTCQVNKSGSTFEVAASTTVPLGANTSIVTGGTVTVNGTLTFNSNSTVTLSSAIALIVNSGGTVTNMTTLACSGSVTLASGSTTASGLIINWTMATTCTVNVAGASLGTCTITTPSGAQAFQLSGGTLPLGNNPTVQNDLNNGAQIVDIITGTVTMSGTLTLNGSMRLSNGTTLSGALTAINVTGNFTVGSTATFPTGVSINYVGTFNSTHNVPASKSLGVCSITKTANTGFTVASGATLPLGTNATSTIGIGGLATYTNSGTTTIAGTWVVNGRLINSFGTGVVSGALTSLTLSENLDIQGTSTFPAGVEVTFTGTLNAQLTVSAGSLGRVIVSKSGSATFTVNSGTTCPLGTNPTTVAPGGMTISGATVSATGNWTYTGSAGVGPATSATTVFQGTFVLCLSECGFSINASATWPATAGVKITFTGGTQRTFAGGTRTFASLERAGSGAGELVITGTNTFGFIKDNDGSVAHTITFPNVTTTLSGADPFQVSGSATKLVTLRRTGAAGTWTLTASDPAAKIESCQYLSISNSTVDASPVWYAGATSTNGGGNTNWVFDDAPTGAGDEMPCVMMT